MPFLDTFYLAKNSRVLIGNTGIKKEDYFAILYFLTDIVISNKLETI